MNKISSNPIEFLFNVVTAPLRHSINIIDGLVTGDHNKAFNSAAKLGLSFVAGGIIGELVEGFAEGLDGVVEVTDPDLHHVTAHGVNSYYRGDGTFVNGYHVGDHLQHDPTSAVSHIPNWVAPAAGTTAFFGVSALLNKQSKSPAPIIQRMTPAPGAPAPAASVTTAFPMTKAQELLANPEFSKLPIPLQNQLLMKALLSGATR